MTKEERAAALAKLAELRDQGAAKKAAIQVAKQELNALRKQERELKASMKGK